MSQARVFISCGQAQGTNEVAIAGQIADQLSQMGYLPYIAVRQQTLRGLRENLFAQLSNSEYFLFVDFRREQIGPNECRGSLFSHQELAIASFLELEVLAFQEEGVRPRDGMIGAFQTNAIRFTDRSTLIGSIVAQVQASGWSPNWRNGLVLSNPSQQPDARDQLGRTLCFFHIDVLNQHNRIGATNCSAYLKRIATKAGHELPLHTVELKWAGIGYPFTRIAPRTTRRLDALYFERGRANMVYFSVVSDSSQFAPKLQSPRVYELTYVVMSDNLPQAEASFELEFGGNLNGVRFDIL